MKKKKYVNLNALSDAVEDGRIDIWTDSNGYICLFNKRTKNMIRIEQTQQMEYDPFAYSTQ